jgi:hypothetical protein
MVLLIYFFILIYIYNIIGSSTDTTTAILETYRIIRQYDNITIVAGSGYDIYQPFVAPFVRTLTEDILAPPVAEEASTHYTFDLDVVSWLSGATARPAVPYLTSVPISLPLIGLTQLVQYLVVCHIAGLTLKDPQLHVSKTNQHLPASRVTPQWAEALVVTGPPKASLFRLHLCKHFLSFFVFLLLIN